MRLATRTILYVVGATLIGLSLRCVFNNVLAPILFFYAMANANEIRNVVETPSPDGSVIVDAFQIYGTAISPDWTEVVIRPKNERFDPRHNFELFSVEGLAKTQVVWTGNSKLDIMSQPIGSYPDTRVPKWHEVTVTYSYLQ
jgi:hypothetical protein